MIVSPLGDPLIPNLRKRNLRKRRLRPRGSSHGSRWAHRHAILADSGIPIAVTGWVLLILAVIIEAEGEPVPNPRHTN